MRGFRSRWYVIFRTDTLAATRGNKILHVRNVQSHGGERHGYYRQRTARGASKTARSFIPVRHNEGNGEEVGENALTRIQRKCNFANCAYQNSWYRAATNVYTSFLSSKSFVQKKSLSPDITWNSSENVNYCETRNSCIALTMRINVLNLPRPLCTGQSLFRNVSFSFPVFAHGVLSHIFAVTKR